MSWRIHDHPEGGLQITHLVEPCFTARWTTGDFPIEAIREGEFFWTDEGSGEDDAIHLWEFVWEDQTPPNIDVERLMKETTMAIDQTF